MKQATKDPVARFAPGIPLALAALLAACGALPDKPAHATLYDFGPGPMNATAAAPAATSATPATSATSNAPVVPVTPAGARSPIALSDVEANARLDGSQILYRFAYADGNELRPYGQSRWSLAPAQLLQQRLRDALSAGHVVMAPQDMAGAPRNNGRRPATLRVTLEEFSQVFDSPTHSVGLVRINAMLAANDAAGQRVMLQRSFSARSPAPSNDAAGGVKALAAASDAVVAELVAWVDAAGQAGPVR